MQLLHRILFIAMLSSISLVATAQITLSGIVLDSASLKPLSYVSIQVSGKVTTITDDQGLFELSGKSGDTITFNRIGFNAVTIVRFVSESGITVSMSESTTLLNSITIFGDYKLQDQARWKRYIILPKPFQNPTMKDSMGMVQTFGAGVKIPGVFSYFTDEQIEKRKMKRVTKDLAATEVYREVMSSEKVKADLMQLFSISEEKYFKKIEVFNLQYSDAAYLKSRDEVINLLIGFFALKEK